MLRVVIIHIPTEIYWVLAKIGHAEDNDESTPRLSLGFILDDTQDRAALVSEHSDLYAMTKQALQADFK